MAPSGNCDPLIRLSCAAAAAAAPDHHYASISRRRQHEATQTHGVTSKKKIEAPVAAAIQHNLVTRCFISAFDSGFSLPWRIVSRLLVGCCCCFRPPGASSSVGTIGSTSTVATTAFWSELDESVAGGGDTTGTSSSSSSKVGVTTTHCIHPNRVPKQTKDRKIKRIVRITI